jgi:hypothetical protein
VKRTDEMFVGDIMVSAASVSDTRLALADQNAVHDPSLAPHVARVLEAVVHPEALVTDESIVRHFLESGEGPHRWRRRGGPWQHYPGDPVIKAQNDALLASMAQQFGVPVERDDLVVAVAYRIRAREQAGGA